MLSFVFSSLLSVLFSANSCTYSVVGTEFTVLGLDNPKLRVLYKSFEPSEVANAVRRNKALQLYKREKYKRYYVYKSAKNKYLFRGISLSVESKDRLKERIIEFFTDGLLLSRTLPSSYASFWGYANPSDAERERAIFFTSNPAGTVTHSVANPTKNTYVPVVFVLNAREYTREFNELKEGLAFQTEINDLMYKLYIDKIDEIAFKKAFANIVNSLEPKVFVFSKDLSDKRNKFIEKLKGLVGKDAKEIKRVYLDNKIDIYRYELAYFMPNIFRTRATIPSRFLKSVFIYVEELGKFVEMYNPSYKYY